MLKNITNPFWRKVSIIVSIMAGIAGTLTGVWQFSEQFFGVNIRPAFVWDIQSIKENEIKDLTHGQYEIKIEQARENKKDAQDSLVELYQLREEYKSQDGEVPGWLSREISRLESDVEKFKDQIDKFQDLILKLEKEN